MIIMIIIITIIIIIIRKTIAMNKDSNKEQYF